MSRQLKIVHKIFSKSIRTHLKANMKFLKYNNNYDLGIVFLGDENVQEVSDRNKTQLTIFQS